MKAIRFVEEQLWSMDLIESGRLQSGLMKLCQSTAQSSVAGGYGKLAHSMSKAKLKEVDVCGKVETSTCFIS